MTVIASVQSFDGVFTISDIMVSSPQKTLKPNFGYPLYKQNFFRLSTEKEASNSIWVPSGTAQKAVTFGSGCLVLWAGNQLFAKMAIKELVASYGRGHIIPLYQIFARSGLEEKYIRDLSLIVFRDDGIQLRQDTHNLDGIFTRGPVEVLYSGSGSFSSITDLEDITFRNGTFTLERMFLDRAAMAISGDILSQDNSNFLFGGWFEFTRCTNPNFVKIPYAIKLWSVDGKHLFDGPAFVSGYNHEDLLIFYRDPRLTYTQPPTFVPDLLRRSGRRAWDGCTPENPHEVEFHFVHFQDLNKCYWFFLVGDQKSVRLENRQNNCKWSFRSDVIHRFIDRVRSETDVGYNVSKPSNVV